MQKGGTASQITYYEKRFLDRLCFVPGEENVIQKKTKPVDERPQWPDSVKEQQKY